MSRLLLILALFLPLPTLAAFEARVAPGDDATHIEFLLSATTTSVNAVEGTLILPPGAHASKLYIGESVIGSWVEAPREEGGRIRFAGIIPGGFTGSATPGEGLRGPAKLFSFELYGAPGSMTVVDAAEYLNDGAGTKIVVNPMVVPETQVQGSVLREDRTPPEYVEAAPDAGIVEGKIVLLISAFDADSGIDRFEVQEGDGVWNTTSAAYQVQDASGLLPLSVRAYDRAGNFIETRIEGRNAPYLKLAFVGIVLLALLGIGAALVYFKKRRSYAP